MSDNPIGRKVGGILQRATMLLVTSLGDTRPVALATWLLNERVRGRVPVWPTTNRLADRLVEGLEALSETRGPEVIASIMTAPTDTALDWPERLRGLTQ